MGKMISKSILGVKTSSTNKGQVLEFVRNSLKTGHKFFIVTPNPEIVVEAQKNPLFLEALNSADVAVTDGIGLKLANSSLNTIKGRELVLDLFQLANEQKLKIFLLGSDKKTIDKSLALVSKIYPYVIARGHPGPILNKQAQTITEGNRQLEQEVLRQINSFKPDFLFVAFGAPKQELWVKKHFQNLKVGGAMVVGGSLDYFAGSAKVPPKIVAQLGLEWLWRLIREPKRIKRIFNAVVVFPWLLLSKNEKS
jgi:N-acetylglucosaminyldiphosphoundecaprenol N-acetyl-beta-D-mannosaminyltransferase